MFLRLFDWRFSKIFDNLIILQLPKTSLFCVLWSEISASRVNDVKECKKLNFVMITEIETIA